MCRHGAARGGRVGCPLRASLTALGAAPGGAAPAARVNGLMGNASLTAAMAKRKQRRRKPRGRTKPGRRREAGAAASQPQLSAFHTTPPSAQRRTAAPRGRGDRSAAIRPGPAHLPPDAAAAAARASLCSLPLHGVKHVVKLLAAVAALLYCWCHSAVAQVRPLLRADVCRCAAHPPQGRPRV